MKKKPGEEEKKIVTEELVEEIKEKPIKEERKSMSQIVADHKEEALKEEKGKKKKKKGKKDLNKVFLHVSLQDKVLFARHLAVSLKAGMSMQDALELIRDQSKSKSFKTVMNALLVDTANGMYLSASLQQFQRIFGQLFINIVNVGESSGTLIDNLNYLAVEMKKKQVMKSKVRGALIYPAVIFVATIGIVAGLMIGVFPKILPVFANLNITLPITTKILIAVSKFTTEYTLSIALGLIAIVVAIIVMSRYEWYKRTWHFILLRLPIVGKISVKVNSASLARILGLLLKSGVKVIEAVNITANALENRMYRRELKVAGETLRRGEFFSLHLAKNQKMFPPVLVNMIQVGENTGNLTDNLQYLSEFYEEDVDEILKNLSSIIEPFLLLFMGLLVGFIALSVVTPIYQISQTLTL